MVLPGWNVSEPIDLAVRLYEVVESLRSAPESAKAFVLKINQFRGNLNQLQGILEAETASRPSEGLGHLRATVLECQAFVERCKEYSEGFAKLTKDGRGKMDGAGQAALWMLQEKKVARLKDEIDGHMYSIGLTIAIKTFADDRTRRDSHLTTSSVNAPLRSDTLTTLPPCSSSQPKPTQSESTQHAKTPADLLGLSIQHVRKLSETEVPHFELGTLFSDSKGISATPQTSPNALRPLAEHDEPSGFHSKQDLKRLGQGQNTINEVALSQTGAGISSALPELSIGVSRVSTSPTASSRRTSTTEATTSTSKRGSIFAPEYAVVELVMENLIGVQASFYRTKHYRYNVSRVESFRNKQTGRRYVIISPPESFKIKLYFVLPTERVIAHSEHPQAYGSSNTYRVKFIEPHILRSQKISSERRTSDFSSVPPPSFTPVSSATSGASSTSPASPVLNIDMGLLKEESRRQEYDFENEEDYRRFQEMLMGPGVKLQLQVPIQSISVKRFNAGNSAEESRLQYLRLWQYGRRQTLMFFANLTSSKYREYQMENLRPIESKSKTSIRLDVHLPGMVRRRSSSKSPILVAKSPAQEQARLGGYADENDLSDLNYLLIEFSSAQGRPEFLREARFHSSPEDLMASPSSFCSKSPT